ncbi:hypothetical protein WR25_23207 [Diploscapter pachys]|uniref:Uncharacterized protein n=1 Tax=Diploscapter pachys TaxID=2018661 RepID=A0A2A2KBM9_9BILA|nr:hypothetical protein WR25_23207 [Diploscapter pachys]
MDVGDREVALAVRSPAPAFVERELRRDQLGPVLRQPLHAVERPARLLAAGQRQFDRALRAIAALLEPDHRIDPDRVHRLHVGGAAAVEIAVFLDHLVGIARPVLGVSDDDVEMADQQHRLHRAAGARQRHDQPALLGMIGYGKAGDRRRRIARRQQPRLDRAGECGAAARRDAGVGLHHFLVERAEAGLVGAQRCCGLLCRPAARQRQQHRADRRPEDSLRPSRHRLAPHWLCGHYA